ncbi:MAG: hypothetical protein ACI4EG_03185 [Fusicatenibacter sp.]
MKLVSPKTLLAALFGILFIIMKVVTFDGLQDLFWIAFFGYLTIKGLIVAFSQEAYDEDVRKAYQGKALYRDLFGRFAYIATDIPLIIILLAGLLAGFCPATTLLKVILGALLIFAVGYALWLSWYISKHKRLRMESGEWGAATLTKEEERAWNRSSRWHGFCLGIIAVLCVLYLIFGDPRIYINNEKLKDAFMELTADSVTLEEIVPFEWTTVYTFDPYSSQEFVERISGSKSPVLKESVNEGMTHIVFKNSGRVVASVCEYPTSIGYSLFFTGGKYTYYGYPDGGYSHIEYGDQVQFEVTKDSGIVRLYAFVNE